MRRQIFFIVILFVCETNARASGHGPVFGLATPTNPKGGFSVDLGTMGRVGTGTDGVMLRGALGYGITENLKVSVSAPVIFATEALQPARMSGVSPMGGDFEGLLTWRFHRSDTGVGSRIESALIGGVVLPGPQDMAGPLRNLKSRAGGVIGAVTGIASRSNYFWAGMTYQRYAESSGDR